MIKNNKQTTLTHTSYWPYLAAASVLTDFVAEKLLPLGEGTVNLSEVGSMLMEHGEAITIGPAKGKWSITSITRRAVLSELKRKGKLIKALQANRKNMPDNPTQRAIDDLLQGKQPKLMGTLRDLLGIEQALNLIGPVNETSQDFRSLLTAKIEKLRLLEPLQRLVNDGFSGRKKEMKLLRGYVDELPSKNLGEWITRGIDNVLDIFRHRPPLVVWGPGGVGKSTLLAQFLLDHAGPEQSDPIPFIFLDFDRGQLDPLQPDSLLEEAFRQIQVQFPELATTAASYKAATKLRLAVEDKYEYSKSSHYKRSSALRKYLINLLNAISDQHKKNLLVFVDTFEVVQRRGPTPVFNVLKFAAELLRYTPNLRFVIAGRAALRDADFQFTDRAPIWKELPLKGFDNDAGGAYLKGLLKKLSMTNVSPNVLNRIVTILRGNPLSIRLAAQVFYKEGITALEDTVSKARYDAAFSQERIQGMLQNRIVDHLPEKLRKIADPGLVVRRITAEVIVNVLAEPCELDIRNLSEAEELFKDLQSEVSIVEPIGENMLRHRPDVRILMLPLLRDKLGAKAREIDEKAVMFWAARNDPESRAEEIYHLLWLGVDTETLENAWQRGPVAKWGLEDALDEFEELNGSPETRIWLSSKLEREISSELEDKANLINWERNTELRVRSLLSSGSVEDALKALSAKNIMDRIPTSSLWLLKIEALKLLGRNEEALQLLNTDLKAAEDAQKPAHIHSLLLHKAILLERTDRLGEALESVLDAAQLVKVIGSPSKEFENVITLSRLLRKVGRKKESEELHQMLAGMIENPLVKQTLEERPSLLSEAVAEIGLLRPDLFAMNAKKMELDLSETEIPVSTLVSLGVVYANQGEFQKAEELFHRAATTGDLEGQAMAFLYLGNINLRSGNLEKAQEGLEKSLKLAEQVQSLEIGASALNSLGTVFLFRGDIQYAINAYEQSLKIAQKNENLIGELNVLGNLANVYSQLGETQHAIALFKENLKIARELNDRRSERQILNNLASAYSKMGDNKQAIEFGEISLKKALQLNDIRGEGIVLSNLGNFYTKMNQFQRALELSIRALEISQKIGDSFFETKVLGNLGIISLQLGNLEQAHKFCQRQLDIVKDQDVMSEGIARCCLALVMVYKGEKEAAVEEMHKASKILQKVNSPFGEQMSSQLINMSKNLQSSGNVQNDEAFQKIIITALNSIDNLIEWNVLNEIKQDYFEALIELRNRARDSVETNIKQSLNTEF